MVHDLVRHNSNILEYPCIVSSVFAGDARISFEFGVKRTMHNLVGGKGGVVHGMMIYYVQAVVERGVWDRRERQQQCRQQRR